MPALGLCPKTRFSVCQQQSVLMTKVLALILCKLAENGGRKYFRKCNKMIIIGNFIVAPCYGPNGLQ